MNALPPDAFRLLAESVADAGLFLLDPAGRVASWNGGAERLTGHAAADVLGRPFDLLYTPADVEAGRPRADLAAATAAGRHEVEGDRRRADGSTFRAAVAVTALPAGFGVLLRDVSARTRAEDELRRVGERVRAVLEHSWDVISVHDADGRMIYQSPSIKPVLGYDEDELLGQLVIDYVHPDDAPTVEAETARIKAAPGTRTVVVVRFRHKNGSWRWCECAGTNLLDHPAVRGIVFNARDVTDLLGVQSRLRAVLDSTTDAILTTDERGRIVSANAAAHRQFGYPPGGLVGRPVADLLPAARWADGAVQDLLGRRQDGFAFPVELTAAAFQVDGERHFTGVARDVSERRQAEAELRLRDRALQAVSQGIVITDATRPDNPIIFAGGGFEQLTGYRPDEAVGRNPRFMQNPQTDPAVVAQMREAVAARRPWSGEVLNHRKDGTAFWNALSVTPVRDGDRVTHFVGVLADVTERRLLEEQFRQAQKMEAVGRLAAGVAHDFNNLLTVINGYTEMMLTGLPPADPMRELAAEVHQAGERAGTLTRQLLLFSRPQPLEPKVLDLNAVAGDAERLLRRLIGEHVRFVTRLAPGLGPVRADRGQIEQALVNLCVNARDAMPPGGGRLTVETRAATPAEADRLRLAGRHAVLAVGDNGTGMDEATKARIFEPFFTTKGPGKGTGLGLAVVFGVVKQAGGRIEVDTEPGRGTTVRLYFPQVSERPAAGPPAPGRLLPPGTETILLAEDDEAVRALARHVLTGCGYTLLEAADGREAVRLADAHAGPLDLLIADVVMPFFGGGELAGRVSAERPRVKVLFLSGYPDDAISGTFAFLPKPFTPSGLAQKVREVLDARGTGG